MINSRPSNVALAQSGFSLIELLIAMGIISVLSSITFVAINPAKQLSDARDAKRSSTTREIENAISQYLIEEWNLPSSELPLGEENAINICRQGVTNDPTCINLDVLVPDYIASIPVDSAETEENHTGYNIYQDESERSQVISLHYGVTSSDTEEEDESEVICITGLEAGYDGDEDSRTFTFDTLSQNVSLVTSDGTSIGNNTADLQTAYTQGSFDVYVDGIHVVAGGEVASEDQNAYVAGYSGADSVSPDWYYTNIAQVFTAGISGNLEKLEMYLAKNSSNNEGEISIGIYEFSAGDPDDGTLLATSSFDIGSITSILSNAELVEISDFTPAPYVTEGDTYAIVIQPVGEWSGSSPVMYWLTGIGYEGGNAYLSTEQAWSEYNWHHKFITSVSVGAKLAAGSIPISNTLSIDSAQGTMVFDSSVNGTVTVDYCYR